MRYWSQVKPISYLTANAAEVLTRLSEQREPLVITQNGEGSRRGRMSMNEADTRSISINPLLQEKGYVSCERIVWTISTTSRRLMCCSRKSLSIWRRP
jgi:hypothetical protein